MIIRAMQIVAGIAVVCAICLLLKAVAEQQAQVQTSLRSSLAFIEILHGQSSFEKELTLDPSRRLMEFRIKPALLKLVQANVWEVPVPELCVADEPHAVHLPERARFRSTVQLFFRGSPLGPPHASNEEIAELGDGRFSHWRSPQGSCFLRFSLPRSAGTVTREALRDLRLLAFGDPGLRIAWKDTPGADDLEPAFRELLARSSLKAGLGEPERVAAGDPAPEESATFWHPWSSRYVRRGELALAGDPRGLLNETLLAESAGASLTPSAQDVRLFLDAGAKEQWLRDFQPDARRRQLEERPRDVQNLAVARVVFSWRRPTHAYWCALRDVRDSACSKLHFSFPMARVFDFLARFSERTGFFSGTVDLLWPSRAAVEDPPYVLRYLPMCDLLSPRTSSFRPRGSRLRSFWRLQQWHSDQMVLAAVDDFRASRPNIFIDVGSVGIGLRRSDAEAAPLSPLSALQIHPSRSVRAAVDRLCRTHLVTFLTMHREFTDAFDTMQQWLDGNKFCYHKLLVVGAHEHKQFYLHRGDSLVDSPTQNDGITAHEATARGAQVIDVQSEEDWDTLGVLCVYSVVTGGYDEVADVTAARLKNPGVRVLLFSDPLPKGAQPGEDFRGWEVHPLPSSLDVTPAAVGDKERSRAAKFLPALLAPLRTCELTMHLDANTEILTRLTPLFARMTPAADVALYRIGRSWEQEMDWIFESRGYPKSALAAQVQRYEAEGFQGMHSPEGCSGKEWRSVCNATYFGKVLIRRMRERRSEVDRFGQIWWEEFKTGVQRDQLSLPYALWKSNVDYVDLGMASRGATPDEEEVTKLPAFAKYFGRGGHKAHCPEPPAGDIAEVHFQEIGDVPCADVMDEVLARLAGQPEKWQDPQSNGTYAIIDKSKSHVELARFTSDQKHSDKMILGFVKRTGGDRCLIRGCSRSQVASSTDSTTQYCNLLLRVCGEEGKPPCGLHRQLHCAEKFT